MPDSWSWVAIVMPRRAATATFAGRTAGATWHRASTTHRSGPIAGALAGAALQLIPPATEALIAKLPPAESAQLSTTPPVAAAQPDGSPPSSDVLDDIEGNSRGITRQEVEAALVDWCASHGDAPLCVKLRINPSRPGASDPGYAPPSQPYYRSYSEPGGYYRPGRYPTWNGCQQGWTVQDGLCKPYRGSFPAPVAGERIVFPPVRIKEHVHGLASLHLPQNQSAGINWN